MSSISSRSFPGRPIRRQDFHRQKSLNPARCQPMTVSGRKIIKAPFQPDGAPGSLMEVVKQAEKET
jgi:hypothetical protein